MASEQKVEAVERAFAILEAFADGAKSLNLTALSKKTGFYPSTLLRLAASLERFGYLRRGKDGNFRLGPTLWRLGVIYQANFDLSAHIRPILSEIAQQTEETAAFYVCEGERRICLYRENGPRPIRSNLDEGAELPLDRGASAHVLVAFSGGKSSRDAKIRSEGFSISLGERDPETAAIAVPVFNEAILVGALGVTGPISRFDDARIPRMRTILIDCAKRVSKSLQHE